LAKIFLARNLPHQAQITKTRIDKWDYIKLKSFCTTKEIINRVMRQSTEWEDIFVNHTPDKGLICKLYKKSSSSIAKNQINRFKNG
jgi:hypothetical protein